MDLGVEDLEPVGGLAPNAILLYVSLAPPSALPTRVWVDDLDVVEWRRAADEPEGWCAVDWLRSDVGPLSTPLDWIGW